MSFSEKERPGMVSSSRIHRAALVGLTLLPLLPGRVRGQAASPDAVALKAITVSFKLDPRLQNATYGGERWVSPPTFVGANAQDMVEARAEGVDAKGQKGKVDAEWLPSDPEMVAVAPGHGEQVKITVKRAGESKLKIEARGLSTELGIKAKYLGQYLQVEITQPSEGTSGGVAATDTTAFASHEAKVSYALGMNLAGSLRRAAVDVDVDVLVKGFKDGYSGDKTLLSEQEVQAVLVKLPQEVKKEQIDLEAEKRREVAERNKRDSEAFLSENQKREGVVSLPSGLQYQILKAGDGKKPAADDAVVCRYRGMFVNGAVFDRFFEKKPVTLPIKTVIKGWAEALKLMPVGSKWRLFIPPELAYGEKGVKGVRGRKGGSGIEIAPNTALIFDLELVDIRETAGSGATVAASGPAKRSEQRR
jgi:FKBP-type peptidyl-prolyl cis-trans isomerase